MHVDRLNSGGGYRVAAEMLRKFFRFTSKILLLCFESWAGLFLILVADHLFMADILRNFFRFVLVSGGSLFDFGGRSSIYGRYSPKLLPFCVGFGRVAF